MARPSCRSFIPPPFPMHITEYFILLYTIKSIKSNALLDIYKEALKWSHWVVVFGYNESSLGSKRETIVARLFDHLSPYGDILEHSAGSGNFTFFRSSAFSILLPSIGMTTISCFRFSHASEAARCAAALNGSFLSPTSMVGVLQLTPELGRQTNLRLDEHGCLDTTAFGTSLEGAGVK